MVQFRKHKDGSTYPISEKKDSSYYGQTHEASWTKSSISDLKKDLPKLVRSKEKYTYHGRSGRPFVHQSEMGKEFIMVRAKGGGTKRLYLTPETKRKLESKEGY